MLRKPVRMSCALVPVTLFAMAALADDKPEPKLDLNLRPLARFAGEWTVDGKWAAGNELHARAVYEWGLGGKILRAKTYVKDGDGEYQRYESTMTWHPGKKCLYEISFAVDGAVTEHKVEAKDENTLLIDFSPIDPAHPGKVRQTLKFIDDDHHTWKVEVHGDKGWETLIDATWARKK